MSEGFTNKKSDKRSYNEEVQDILRKYKKIKKYMRSSLFNVKMIDGTEKIVSELMKDQGAN
jgi:formiminotetrahydrofolate cyclodeaminase